MHARIMRQAALFAAVLALGVAAGVGLVLSDDITQLSSVPPGTADISGKGVAMRLLRIPVGTFLMSSLETEAGRESGEGPQHQVTISEPFYMGVCEVTQQQYEAVVGSNPSRFKGASNPVDNVSWDDAVAFCKKLSAETGMTVRLPTEAQWEYACRAGSKTRFGYGDDDEKLSDYAWYVHNSDGKTHPVAQKKANDWGLYDMHGNLWEWCSDRHDEGTTRVLRGGSWDNLPQACRSAIRRGRAPDYRYVSFGFRVVVDCKSVDAETAGDKGR